MRPEFTAAEMRTMKRMNDRHDRWTLLARGEVVEVLIGRRRQLARVAIEHPYLMFRILPESDPVAERLRNVLE